MTEPIAIDPGTLWDEIYKTDVDIHAQNNYISFSYLKALPGTMQDHVFGASNTLLEVACGPGMISARLASEYPSLQILGTDISPRAIEYAAENFKLPNLKYAVLDIRAVAGQW
ncbi:MAG: class I SAM-dependent methyltransferase, partial [Gammaproteobacteria bacterium]|nr:class I SAM-dependent methyltransferase [Gammaproteobacteria bacterium]